MCGGSCEVDEANPQVKVQTFRITGCWTMSQSDEYNRLQSSRTLDKKERSGTKGGTPLILAKNSEAGSEQSERFLCIIV
jgi:hypothetical protein